MCSLSLNIQFVSRSVCMWTRAMPIILYETCSFASRFPSRSLSFCSLEKAANTPLVQFGASSSGSHCTQGEWVYTRTKKLHYPPSLITVHAARKQPPCCSALSNCPHVLGRAEVGEILNCLSRNIRSTIRLAVPAHMALFFILGAHSGKERRERSDEEWMRRK